MKKHLWLSVVFFLLASICLAQNFQGKVVGVTDGDTISVLHNGVEEKIRLNGIDAPESDQDFGSRAKQICSDLCFDTTVTVSTKEKDRYGRTVADVFLSDGRNLNQLMVGKGFAWWYRQYARDNKDLQMLEYRAKRDKVGLWTDANPVEPWNFRRKQTSDTEKAQPLEKTPPIRFLEDIPALPAQTPVASYPVQPYPDTQTYKTAPVNQTDQKEDTVYITKTGAKYHRSSCRYLRKSMISISRSAAMQGYGACSVCNP